MKRGVRSESKAPFAIVKSISALPNKRRKSGASRTDAQRRSQASPPDEVTSIPDQLDLLRAPAAVLVDVDAALRVDGEAVGLVEFAGVGSGAAEIAEDFAAATLHDLDARVVLVDHEHQALLAVAREVDGDRGAAAVVDPGGHRRRGHVEAALKLAHLIEDADLAAVHRLVAFRTPLAHEVATGVEYGDLRVAGVVLTVGDVDIAIAAIDKNARRHVEGGSGRIEGLALLGAVGGVVDALLAHFQQQLAAVVGRFLPHAGRRGG